MRGVRAVVVLAAALVCAPCPSVAEQELDLQGMSVFGNRELPKVLYIVPWQKADLGDMGGPPVGSLLDEVLEPLDRDVFRRQLDYYEALHAGE